MAVIGDALCFGCQMGAAALLGTGFGWCLIQFCRCFIDLN